MKNKKTQPNHVNCFHCSHFYLTYNTRFPYGCHAMGFHSREMPSWVTRNYTGHDCLFFTPKKKKR